MGRKHRAYLLEQSKQEPNPNLENKSLFRALERAYKRRYPCACLQECKTYGCKMDTKLLSNCIDLETRDESIIKRHYIPSLSGILNESKDTPRNNMKPDILQTCVLETIKCPGLYIIKNLFTPETQRTLITASLKHYAKPPNTLNLNTFYDILSTPDNKSIWEMHCNDIHSITNMKSDLIRLKSKEVLLDSHLINGSESPSLKDITATEAVEKFRWASLGRIYNWAKKEYTIKRKLFIT